MLYYFIAITYPRSATYRKVAQLKVKHQGHEINQLHTRQVL